MVIKVSGIFRPNLLVMNPKNKLPIKPPIQMNDATQDDSSIEILPEGNGVSLDVNKTIFGLAQPHVIPYPKGSKFTV